MLLLSIGLLRVVCLAEFKAPRFRLVSVSFIFYFHCIGTIVMVSCICRERNICIERANATDLSSLSIKSPCGHKDADARHHHGSNLFHWVFIQLSYLLDVVELPGR